MVKIPESKSPCVIQKYNGSEGIFLNLTLSLGLLKLT